MLAIPCTPIWRFGFKGSVAGKYALQIDRLNDRPVCFGHPVKVVLISGHAFSISKTGEIAL
jgi:hypothetical protein